MQTITTAEYISYWSDRVERDLTPFADPGTCPEVTSTARTINASWLSRGRPNEATMIVSMESGVQVSFRNQSLTYHSFLAAPELSDLLGLAKMILQVNQKTLFVPTLARMADDPDAEAIPAIKLIQDQLAKTEDDVTRILMITGEAGAGKTKVLQQLVRDQAEAYQRGKTSKLYLYINAQGRALARFNEALATELQDLRALLTYHSVAPLVRLGLIVPIIDGFDELLGVGGYDDAFSSLTGFVEELDGQGQIIASARSTYYEQEFVARATSASSLGSQAFTQVPIEVIPWGEDQFSEYVKLYSSNAGLDETETVALTERALSIFAGPNVELKRKPLFVARTIDVLRADRDFSGGEDLLKRLVFAYLERERREKLLDRHGGSLLTIHQLELLFRTLAEEMWNQETRELDKRSVREVAEYVLVTEGLPESHQRVVIERMPTLAFLIPSERAGGISFEHEMFFAHFLAQMFVQRLLGEVAGIRLLLGRSVLPLQVAISAADELQVIEQPGQPSLLQLILDKLSDAALHESPRATQIRENAGALVGAFLKASASRGPYIGLRIRNIVMPGGDLTGVVMQRCNIVDSQFRRVDLSSTKFVDCRADNILLSEVIISLSSTRLELRGIDIANEILGLRLRDKGLVRGLFDPEEARNALISCGAIGRSDDDFSDSIRSVSKRYLSLLERLTRAYMRSNPVCLADDGLASLFHNEYWKDLEKLLLKHELVLLQTRATKGRPKDFLRRQFLPEELMAGADRTATVSPNIRSFWDELENLSGGRRMGPRKAEEGPRGTA